jgi:CheY-like chemotaxis protein
MNMRALVIDDSSSTRKILGHFMRRMNYDVVEAANGQEALERMQEMPDIQVAFGGLEHARDE